ncbi:hypothetical protein BDV40DRAFT_225578 [Aspergillus tamarii]|uniref:Uncharacterized protein n=1 Tax=Aspergillus tamarii TaxID=41984 RepID=A0A5N6V786_ASPTM|nr:hypothetical protein BDV40DRAFT_225578 [Aspergillus tamarii]
MMLVQWIGPGDDIISLSIRSGYKASMLIIVFTILSLDELLYICVSLFFRSCVVRGRQADKMDSGHKINQYPLLVYLLELLG